MEIQARLINDNIYKKPLIQGKSTEVIFHLDKKLDENGEKKKESSIIY